ncbi:MAG: alpha/beta hydrolase, partial [Syntrophomonadaceae bacterium]|nr:alpha/beta hydrolase [Syntrophomonadaceae bacterium]
MKKYRLTSSSGKQLALLVNTFPEGMSHIVVVCHGFLGGKENGGWIHILSDQLESIGMGLVAFDFEGCGESEGDFSEITLSRQAKNLVDVMEQIEKEYGVPLILLGRSFGGSTILAGGSSRKDIEGYILWCTPVFLKDTFSTIMPDEYQRLEKGEPISYTEDNRLIHIKPDLVQDFNNHDMDSYLKNIQERPCLIIHGTADKVVKPDNA